ncbi:hypothetical protein OPAG_07602 [Rhodococcus opacus PD630]|uniref:hypothetical protein n=1 Tax=Rhodococcus TaxID=1827 RepID=UPI00029CCE96|nr:MULTISPECIES: hypothetical protein [Rhodococcus]KXF56845.1 hypothetical protein AXA44_32710 [Rhodococcus sp. SC4]KXX61025.1 hypothetical protein AZG88_35155 [Rhodococcus sp. LB1]RZK85307.1 MAG: hypothetical protein EOP26_05010 [Rhodococcus sp. (in: high G+C Gram-positive bacteria)]AHK27309.1 Histone deacetylase 5 [Rhodococcus opacus PD630]EHI41429.1 hypothetical protein OPAG_07602 [Rhodococcus opacus PD630]
MLIWYVSYGSNMATTRLTCYLRGGCPAGGNLVHTGARDASAPRQSIPVVIPGSVFFAGESRIWGGGRAFYDPDAPGSVAARAFLVTQEQFEDIHAQEPACYDRLVTLGSRNGVPMCTFTTRARGDVVARNAPAPAYLATIADGLREAHGWDEPKVADYLTRLRVS